MNIRFLYFDLGNVLVHFDDQLSCRQMATVAGVPPELVWQAIFGSDLKQQYETGRVDDREFYERLCRRIDARPDFEALRDAGNDIFRPNVSMFPLVTALAAAGYRLGVLSNTCSAHWEFCQARYALLRETFSAYALSYQLAACKPDRAIFTRAADLAGVACDEIFFTDDIAGHIAGARQAGYDAVQFRDARTLAGELRARGLKFNY